LELIDRLTATDDGNDGALRRPAPALPGRSPAATGEGATLRAPLPRAGSVVVTVGPRVLAGRAGSHDDSQPVP